MLMRSLITVLVLAFAMSTPSLAKDDKTTNPGMEKRAEQGKELPAGWKKKLQKGQILNADVYAAGKKITRKQRPEISEPKAGEAWIKVADQLIRIKESNREILEVMVATKKTPPKDLAK